MNHCQQTSVATFVWACEINYVAAGQPGGEPRVPTDCRSRGGEPVAGLLRPGNAGSNTAADHVTAAGLALAQLPKKYRRGRRTLIRRDSGGGTHEFVAWLTKP